MRTALSPAQFVRRAGLSPWTTKPEFVRRFVAGKQVLDLGVVAHSLEYMKNHPDQWLHGFIRKHALSVTGVDILEKEVHELRDAGYDVIHGDALTLRLDRRFDVVVCGDIIEHVSDPEALLETARFHLRDDGVTLVTTPNPFCANRFFNILFDGMTPVNHEHTAWFCPQTMFQLVSRSGLYIADFWWLSTAFQMHTRRRFWGRLANWAGSRLERRRPLLRSDYGVVLRKRPGSSRPFVSVVIPTCNRADYLASAIEDLFAQDYPADRFEIIVVDNGEGGETEARLRSLCLAGPSPVSTGYIRESRKGLVYARHTGAARARGEILLFGDDDAHYEPNWISAVADVYQQAPEAGAVGTRIAIQWDRPPEDWVRRHEGALGHLDYGPEVLVAPGLSINGGSFSIRREVLLRAGGFEPGQVGDYLLGDSEVGLCRKLAALAVPVGWTPRTTMWHRQEASRHGTLADLRRRFWNIGICTAYHDFFSPRHRGLRRPGQTLRTFLTLACRAASAPFIRSKTKSQEHQAALDRALLAAYVTYVFRYRFDVALRRKIRTRDWAYDANYEPAPFVFVADQRGTPATEIGPTT